jgi:hypothetical protein
MEKEPIKLVLDTDEVLDAFKLKRNLGCKTLDIWLNYQTKIDQNQEIILEKKRKRLETEGYFWNEEELKMHFLSHIFDIVDIDVPEKIKLFYERPLVAVIEGYAFHVVCDVMVATPKGVGSPKKPYFFLQEFKKQKGKDQDAEAQMLAAMLVAQFQNEHKQQPVYGCYLQGKHWTFCTLHEKNYCVSPSYDATNVAHLHQIVYALQHLKILILQQMGN